MDRLIGRVWHAMMVEGVGRWVGGHRESLASDGSECW